MTEESALEDEPDPLPAIRPELETDIPGANVAHPSDGAAVLVPENRLEQRVETPSGIAQYPPRTSRVGDSSPMQKPRQPPPKPAASYSQLTAQIADLLGKYDQRLDPLRLENVLREALWYSDFVGELPLERGMFEVLKQWLQSRFKHNDRILIRKVPPAIFVTSMVFSARYSDDEKRQFWNSYAHLVWGTEDTQSFKHQCRKRFADAVRTLEDVTRMVFPISPGKIVDYHVHRHALLPAYLQDDVAAWLKKHLRSLIRTDPPQAASDLMNDQAIEYLPPRVKTFLRHEATRDIAVNLLEQMAAAAQRFQEGEPAEVIADLLLNPIERSLWGELAQALTEQPTARRSLRRADIQWVWTLLEDDWQLRIRNFVAEQRPIEAVWHSSDKTADAEEVIADIQPWRRDDGLWYIDELLMADGALKGEVTLYDAENKQLLTLMTPPLPAGEFIIYRLTQQRQFAIPVDPKLGLSNGYWLVSSEAGIEIRDVHDQVVTPLQSEYFPHALRQATGHRQAARYRLDFPVQIIVNGKVYTIPRRTDNIGQPWLTGKNPVPDLPPSVPATFTDNQILMHFPESVDNLMRLSLMIHTEQFNRRKTIEELAFSLHETDNDCQLDLSHLLPCEAGLYTIDVQRGLRSVLAAPLQCALLPGVSIGVPDVTHIYAPGDLPSVWLGGVSRDQISGDNVDIKADDTGWRITWSDLRQSEYRLLLRFGERRVALAWHLKRHFAFLDKLQSDQTIALENLSEATLTIYGLPGETVQLRVNRHDDPYTDQIKGQRRADDRLVIVFQRHRLLDLIQQQPGERIALDILIGTHNWNIGTILRELPVEESRPQLAPVTEPRPTIHVQTADEKEFRRQFIERVNAIRRSDEWIARYGLLPAWAVAGHHLLFRYHKGNYTYRLPVIPEALAHRGQTGYGQILLKLDGFKPERNYAAWKGSGQSGAQLRIKIPLEEPPATQRMYQLTDDDLDDMWSAYQCRHCGEVIGNRLSSVWTHRHQQLHRHAQQEGTRLFDDVYYDKPLHGSMFPEKWNIMGEPVIPYEEYFDSQWAIACERLSELPDGVQPPQHPLLLEAYQYATVQRLVRRSRSAGNYDFLMRHHLLSQMPGYLKRYVREQPTTMVSAGIRFLDALSPETNFDTQIVSLALWKRMQGQADFKKLDGQPRLSEEQTEHLLQLAMQVCPELLLWAFTWVELFYVHALE